MAARSTLRLAAFSLLAFAPLLAPTALEAQSRDGKFVLSNDGSLLWVEVPVDDESNLVYRSPGGADTNLVDEGDCVVNCGGGAADDRFLTGIGAFPDLSNNATAVFKGNFDVAAGTDDSLASGIFLQSAGAPSPTLVAKGHQSSTTAGDRTLVDGDGDGTADDGICDLEPMPIINDLDVIAFGGYSFRNNAATTSGDCSEDGSTDDLDDEYKNIFRYSTATGVQVMLRTNRTTEADSFVVGAGQSIPADTYYVTDADVINNVRKDSLNNVGQILVRGNIDDNPDPADCVDSAFDSCPNTFGERPLHSDDRTALILISSPSSRTFVAGTGPDTSSDPYQKLEDGVLNDAGQVLYKAEASIDDGEDAVQCGLGAFDEMSDVECDRPDVDEFLNLWSGGSTTTVAERGTAWPGTSTFDFHGFAPHYDLNASGAVAFMGSSNDGATCDDVDLGGSSDGSAPEGNRCQGVFYRSGGTTIEIARTVNANTEDSGGGTSSSLGGFDFEEIASRVILQDDGSVYFMVENLDTLSPCPPDGGGGSNTEHTMIVGWTQSGGLTEILRENALLGTDRILRIYPPEQASAQNGQIFVKVDLDTTGDCDVDDSEIVAIGSPQGGFDVRDWTEVPTLGEMGLVALAALLLLVAVRTLRAGRQTA